MKIKKILCVLFLLFANTTPLHAKVNKNIMIMSKQLPYILFVEVQDEKHMNVRFIPREINIPIACVNTKEPSLKNIDLAKHETCVIEAVEDYFQVKSNHYVYIHLDRLAKTLDLPYKNIDFHKIGNITDYFANVVKKLKISMILHYGDYIESTFEVQDYYDYYKMFNGKKVAIDYSYVNLLYIGNRQIPLDNKFHTNDEK